MAPKAASTKKAATSTHGSYQEMIKIAIMNLKDRKGSSRQAIKKYIKANNNLGATSDAAFNSHINRALAAGEEQNVFERPKGPSGPVKLKKPASATKPAGEKKAAPKKPVAEKKPVAPKAKKPVAEKKAKPAPIKKAPAKPKATKAAPAVDEKPAVVTGKTKSGRVTKTKAPAAKKATPKKAATKKAAPKKATPKKEAAATAAA
jgi:histone H1/5